jgi:hypothetical protein
MNGLGINPKHVWIMHNQVERCLLCGNTAATLDHVKFVREQNALQPQREALFALVRDPDDWKAPIEAFIKYAWNIPVEDMDDAIVHFTGVENTIVHDTFGYTIKSVGYRNGPCGP